MEDQIDLTIMADFTGRLYSKPKESLTERERLQLEIAHVVNTSVEDARSGISRVSDLALKYALALSTERKTLTKVIAAEIRKREKRKAAA